MSLKTFLSSLLPHFERNRILEDVDALALDIESNLAPGYDAAVKQFRGKKLTSQVGRSVETLFHLRYPKERSETHLSFTAKTLVSLSATLEMLNTLVPELFSRDVTKDAMTYKKAAVLQLLSVIRFYNNYAGQYLLRLLAAEDAALAGTEEDAQLLPIDKRYFQENLETFFQAGHVLSLSTAEIAERLGQMQDLQIVTDKINAVAATLGQENVDPLKLGFMPPAAGGLMYRIRASIASYQVAKHNQNKELAKAIQLRLYALKDRQAGKADAKLQQQIEYSEARLARLNEEVAAFEEQYA